MAFDGKPGISADPAVTGKAFCDLLIVWAAHPRDEPTPTSLLESLSWLVSPLSGWHSIEGLRLAREMMAALDSPAYSSRTEDADGDPDVCYFTVWDRKSDGGGGGADAGQVRGRALAYPRHRRPCAARGSTTAGPLATVKGGTHPPHGGACRRARP
jgi:hypothetical protein